MEAAGFLAKGLVFFSAIGDCKMFLYVLKRFKGLNLRRPWTVVDRMVLDNVESMILYTCAAFFVEMSDFFRRAFGGWVSLKVA